MVKFGDTVPGARKVEIVVFNDVGICLIYIKFSIPNRALSESAKNNLTESIRFVAFSNNVS